MKKNNSLFPILWCISIIAAAFILGNALQNRNDHNDSINVLGLGTKDFSSDEVAWEGSFSTKAMDAKVAYSTIMGDKETVRKFFKSKGFKDNEIIFGSLNINKQFKNLRIETDKGVKYENVFDGYTATQNVNFYAAKNPELMLKIEKVVNQTSELINLGIEFFGSQLQYTYSDLPSLKHNLIENASKDAKERALKITQAADGRLGKLKNASMGVFQITGKGSNEEFSYGGNFDTKSKEKSARITVRLTYHLR